MKECEQIHAMILTPLPTASAAEMAEGALITLHPNREYAFAFLIDQQERLAQNYNVPTSTNAQGAQAVAMAIVTNKSLSGTLYAENLDLLRQEIDRAFAAGGAALEIRFNSKKKQPEIYANEIHKVVQQSPVKYVVRDDAAQLPLPAQKRRKRSAHSQPR
jgi:hypothetical protein